MSSRVAVIAVPTNTRGNQSFSIVIHCLVEE